MGDVRFIAGGPGSGKTEAVVSALAGRYEADPFTRTTVLVPTSRHGDQLRRRLAARAGVAFNLHVQTFGQLARDAVRAAGLEPVGRDLATALLARELERASSEGVAPAFEPARQQRGLRNLVAEAIERLLEAGLEPARFRIAAEGYAAMEALAAVYERFLGALAERRWLHPAQVAGAAARCPMAPPGVLVADGFQFFSRGELALLVRLAEGAEETIVTLEAGTSARAAYTLVAAREAFPAATVVNLTGEPPAHEPRGFVAATREDELRGAARRIKQALAGDSSLRPSDCAVTMRQAGPYLRLAREVLAEYDLPFDPAAAERLGERPFGRWLMRLAGLGDQGWRLRDVLWVLRSGFAARGQWRLRDGHVARIAAEAAEARLWAGREVLGSLAARLTDATPRKGESEAALAFRVEAGRGFALALEALAACVQPAEPATVAEHARALEVALFGASSIVRPAVRRESVVEAELEAAREALHALIAEDKAFGGEAVPFAAFAARLAEVLAEQPVLIRQPGGVFFAPMHTMHGLRFRHVAVLGLSEGEFPAPRRRPGLLDSVAGRDVAGRLGLPPASRASEDELWASVTSRTEGALELWRVRLDDRGRPRGPAFVFAEAAGEVERQPAIEARDAASWREAAIACAAAWHRGTNERPAREGPWRHVRAAAGAERRRRSLEPAGVHEGQIAAELASKHIARLGTWSASRFESYQLCPFQFYGKYLLRLSEVEEELEEADAATRGTVVHAILEDAIAPVAAAGRPLTAEAVRECLGRVDREGRDAWERAPGQYRFGRAALWRLAWRRTRAQIERLLRDEAARSVALGNPRVRGVEVRLDAVLGSGEETFAIAGRADRVDTGDGLSVIVDYKTGKVADRRELEDGRKLQLPLYAAMLLREPGVERVVGRYVSLKDGATAGIDTSERDWAAHGVEVATAAIDGMRAGRFEVHAAAGCPRWCPLQTMCRVNGYSGMKAWT